MARQIGVGLLTKLPRNGRLTPFHQASFSTLSRSHLWRYCIANGVRDTIQNANGVFPTSLLTTRFFSNALLQARPKFPVTFRNRRSLHSFNSLDRERRSIFRRFTSDGVVLGLIVTNVAVYLLWKVADTKFMVKNFVISVEHIKRGRLQTLITSAFSHINMFDLITNSLGLYFFGTSIGQSFGPKYLLKLYLGGAIVGSIYFLVYQAFLAPPLQGKLTGFSTSNFPSHGASGAVNAIMLLDVLLFPTTITLLLGCFIVGSDTLRLLQGDHRVSGVTQLGGWTVATFAWLIDRKRRFRRF